MKKMDDKNYVWLFAILFLAVGLSLGFGIMGVTGNAIAKTNTNSPAVPNAGGEVIYGACEYVDYKTHLGSENKTILEVCSGFGGSPKFLTIGRWRTLYNYPGCSPSYSILDDYLESSLDYTPDLNNIRLGTYYGNLCHEVTFPDGSSNEGFSVHGLNQYTGVLCCK